MPHFRPVEACVQPWFPSSLPGSLYIVPLNAQVQRGGAAAASEGVTTGAVELTHYRNTWDGLRKIMAKDGMRGLFKGSGARILFHTPSTMISMSTYDHCKNWYSQMLERGKD
jgi:hypothetical protein